MWMQPSCRAVCVAKGFLCMAYLISLLVTFFMRSGCHVAEESSVMAACPVQSSQITDRWLLIPEVSHCPRPDLQNILTFVLRLS